MNLKKELSFSRPARKLLPWTESVLNDELDTDNSTGCHHFGAVLDQVDHRRQKKFQESVHLKAINLYVQTK